MRDCRLVLEVKDDKILFHAEDTGMLELATMCGALEQLMGVTAIGHGKSLEDVKDKMLDIHLAAMDALTDQIIREGGGGCGS